MAATTTAFVVGEEDLHLGTPSLCQKVSGSNVRHVGCISEALVPKNGTYEVGLYVLCASYYDTDEQRIRL